MGEKLTIKIYKMYCKKFLLIAIFLFFYTSPTLCGPIIKTKEIGRGSLLDNGEKVDYDLDEEEFSFDLGEEKIADMTLSDVVEDKLISDGKMIYSEVKESHMNVFDEGIIEQELSVADYRPTHTSWTLVGIGVGAGALVMIAVVVVLIFIVSRRQRNRKCRKINETG